MHIPRGKGVRQNYNKAVEWYTKAAEQGNAEAQYLLGSCYENGNGVDKNKEEAIKWYKKAAEQGYEDAESSLESLQSGVLDQSSESVSE